MDEQSPDHPGPNPAGMGWGAPGAVGGIAAAPGAWHTRPLLRRSIFTPRIGRHLRAPLKREGRNSE